jgi:hypothetical protein
MVNKVDPFHERLRYEHMAMPAPSALPNLPGAAWAGSPSWQRIAARLRRLLTLPGRAAP